MEIDMAPNSNFFRLLTMLFFWLLWESDTPVRAQQSALRIKEFQSEYEKAMKKLDLPPRLRIQEPSIWYSLYREVQIQEIRNLLRKELFPGLMDLDIKDIPVKDKKSNKVLSYRPTVALAAYDDATLSKDQEAFIKKCLAICFEEKSLHVDFQYYPKTHKAVGFGALIWEFQSKSKDIKSEKVNVDFGAITKLVQEAFGELKLIHDIVTEKDKKKVILRSRWQKPNRIPNDIGLADVRWRIEFIIEFSESDIIGDHLRLDCLLQIQSKPRASREYKDLSSARGFLHIIESDGKGRSYDETGPSDKYDIDKIPRDLEAYIYKRLTGMK
jgi:hypothetical protein